MMAPLPGTCEIVELKKELDSVQCSKGVNSQSAESRMDDKSGKHPILKYGSNYSIDNDLNQIFQAIDLRTSTRALGQLHQKDTGRFQKNALKKPVRVAASQGSGIGISESVTLKQALRGLCISQKLETAAMKRLSKPAPGVSEAGTIKRLYRAVVVEASGSGLPLDEGKASVVEISLVPEDRSSSSSEKIPEFMQVRMAKASNHSAQSSPRFAIPTKNKIRALPYDEIVPASTDIESETSNIEQPASKWKPKSAPSSSGFSSGGKVLEVDEIVPASTEVGSKTPTLDLWQGGKLHPIPSLASSSNGSKVSKSTGTNLCLAKPVFRNKNFIKKKGKQDLTSATSSSNMCGKIDSDLSPSTSKSVSQTDNCTENNLRKEPISPASIGSNLSVEVSSNNVDSSQSKPGCILSKYDRDGAAGAKANVASRSKEKGEFSQSSKSSIGEYSSSTSVSEESNLSGSSCGNRPHNSKDLRWQAIQHVQMQHGSLGLRHFKLHKRLGCGDIGTVYLAELTGTNCLFALKVMDNKFLASRKKMPRAQTEREILQILDHPFLPTLYAHFTTEKLSCLVMDYCPGGDLHVLRQKQPGRSFLEQAARKQKAEKEIPGADSEDEVELPLSTKGKQLFYVAEVLLALEYLHMLGVIYRDLKPENVLVREDGHIMLTDFDLSLRCTVSPTILRSSSSMVQSEKLSGPCSESSCIDPFCLQPSWVQVSCFTPRLISATAKNKKLKSDMVAQVSPLPQLVAEPTSARSYSFVGTHEYLAPEIIKGEGHGSAVDWWTFGIFLYELLFGKTPFKGLGNEDTLANVVSQSLKFPESPFVSFQAKDLIRGLLVKEPENRLGSMKGATDIKQHPFFEGLNWALIRCSIPPELPKLPDLIVPAMESLKKESKCLVFRDMKENLEFELF